MPKGWRFESERHALASKGIKTKLHSYTHSPQKIRGTQTTENMLEYGGDYDALIQYFTDDYKISVRKIGI